MPSKDNINYLVVEVSYGQHVTYDKPNVTNEVSDRRQSVPTLLIRQSVIPISCHLQQDSFYNTGIFEASDLRVILSTIKVFQSTVKVIQSTVPVSKNTVRECQSTIRVLLEYFQNTLDSFRISLSHLDLKCYQIILEYYQHDLK